MFFFQFININAEFIRRSALSTVNKHDIALHDVVAVENERGISSGYRSPAEHYSTMVIQVSRFTINKDRHPHNREQRVATTHC